jgi:glycosyltransferase involved in cell wall biosynthesis
MQPYITLILPAYNEVGAIAGTIESAIASFESHGYTWEIIVAADGTDGTRELVKERFAGDDRVTVIGHAERRGKGRGVREAVALARGSIIGYADADNKVPIEEYAKLDEWFRRGFDIVIGSRVLARSVIERSQPWYRRAGSRIFNRAMRALTGLTDVADSQCGFKFFRRDAAKEIFGRQQIDGYMFDVEILVLARKLGYRMQQVPIRWRDDGDTRLQMVRGNLQNLRDLWRIRIGAARGAER